MSVYLYDEAVIAKLKYWMSDPNISFADTGTLMSYRGDVDEADKVKLHIVSLTRLKWEILSKGKTSLSRDGVKYETNQFKIGQLRAIPIRIEYQIDFISRYRKQNDELVKDFIYKVINNPKLQVIIPYQDENISHNFSLNLGEMIEDNSDIEQHLDKGERFRSTMNITVEDAYLFATTIKDTLSTEVEIEAKSI